MQWDIESSLLGFTKVNNAHNSKQLTGTLFKILDHVGITHKVSLVYSCICTLISYYSLGISHVTMLQTTEQQWKHLHSFTRLNITRCFPGLSTKSSKFCHHQLTSMTASLIIYNSCLAHVINLAMQTLIATYSKAPHHNPHDLKGHELTT